jgi:hypothetical protein
MNAERALLPTTATERLEQSRALLRQALQGTRQSRTRAGTHKPTPVWLANLKSIPLLVVLAEALNGWWSQHPLRVAGTLAADSTRAVLQPLARSNPIALALGALLLGGLVAWSRPWRWLFKPALFAGLGPQLLAKSIAHLPLTAWLQALISMATQKPAASAAHTAPLSRS